MSPAEAYISQSIGGAAGSFDLSARFTADRGVLEPNEHKGSHQTAAINLYGLGAGYTFGDVGPLMDLRAGIEGSYYTSQEERVSGTTFHGADKGGLVTLSAAFNLVHVADFAFGAFARATVAMGYDFAKFSQPRVDTFALGTTAGVRFNSWFGYEAQAYLGSGAVRDGHRQNGVVALGNLFAFTVERWLLPRRAGIKLGPYFEGDIHERFDGAYDAVYSPAGRPDRVRTLRFATPILAYFQVSDEAAVELGYTQKHFGYDIRASKEAYAGARLVL